MTMCAAYTTAPASVYWFTVEWPADKLSWEDFRGKVRRAATVEFAAVQIYFVPRCPFCCVPAGF